MSNVNLFAVTLDDLAAGIDTVWILVGAALVFFMQAGFAIVEAGLTRAKNTGNILMKTLWTSAWARLSSGCWATVLCTAMILPA